MVKKVEVLGSGSDSLVWDGVLTRCAIYTLMLVMKDSLREQIGESFIFANIYSDETISPMMSVEQRGMLTW